MNQRHERPHWLRERAALVALCLFCMAAGLLCACRAEEADGGPVVISVLPQATATPLPLPTNTPEPAFFLNAAAGEVYGGGAYQLVAYENPGASVCPDARVQWESSDERVAIVEEYGVVIGLQTGSAVITATSDRGDTASFSVTVTSDRPQPKETIVYRGHVYKKKEAMFATFADQVAAYVDTLDPTRPGTKLLLSSLRYVGYNYGVKEGNIDCSMLLLYACLDNGISLPRRSDWQARLLEPHMVAMAELQPGDLMFFAYPEGYNCSCSTRPVCKRYLGVHHAAVYLGEAEGRRYVVEASSAVGRVVVRFWDGSTEHAGLRLVLCARAA